jgi:hypothetical protein
MLREIICPQIEEYMLHIPPEYLNKKVEILVLPFFEEETAQKVNNVQGIINKTAGILKDKSIDPVKWQQEIRSEWN